MTTVSRILYENPEGFSTLCKQFRSSRRSGETLRPQTLWRWATKGVKLTDGTVVKLEVIKCAGRFLSSMASIERFLEAQNPDAITLPVPTRTADKRERASNRAAETLAAAGI
jgi:hypothetical protein